MALLQLVILALVVVSGTIVVFVVEATVVALLLAITVKIHRSTATADPNQVDMMRG